MTNSSRNISFLYYFASIFPFAVIMVSWICYYSLGHHTKGDIPFISDTVVKLPQRRIFAAGMAIEMWFIVILYYIRIRYIRSAAAKIGISKNISYMIKLFFMYICIIFVPIGLFVLSAVTLEMNFKVHISGAIVFFFGSWIFYVVSDFAIIQCKIKINLVSLSFTWFIFGFLVLYTVLSTFSKKSLVNAGAIFQYLTALSTFAKLICFKFDIPDHHLDIKKDD